MLLTPSRDTYVTADFPLTLYLFPEKEKKKKGREEGKGGGERGERGRGGGERKDWRRGRIISSLLK